jgi:hypothetical protein
MAEDRIGVDLAALAMCACRRHPNLSTLWVMSHESRINFLEEAVPAHTLVGVKLKFYSGIPVEMTSGSEEE